MKRTQINIKIIFIYLFLLLSIQNLLRARGLAEPTFQYLFELGSKDSDYEFDYPHGVTTDSLGNVFVVDSGKNRIQKFTSNGTFITKWGRKGTGPGQFDDPHDIAVDLKGNVYVVEWGNNRIQKFTSNGKFLTMWGGLGSGSGQFHGPHGIAVDTNGNVYVTEVYNHRVQKFNSNGEFLTKWGSRGSREGRFRSPRGIAIDLNDNIYVADTNNYRIQKFIPNGLFITQWGRQGSGNGEFNSMRGVDVDSYGNIYVVDSINNCVQKFSSKGNFIKKWGSYGTGVGEFDEPCGIDIDIYDNIYVNDVNNNRIQKFGLPSLEFISPKIIETWNRGYTYELRWKSLGNPGESINIELLKSGVLHRVIDDNTDNNGFYFWTIPLDLKPGTDYSLRISNTLYPTVTDVSYINIAPTVVIDYADVSADRCNVGSTQHVWLHARWDNGSEVTSGSIQINETNLQFNSSGWVSLEEVSHLATRRIYSVNALYCSGVTEFNQYVESPNIIWDRIKVTLKVTPLRIDVGSQPEVEWTAIHEFDDSPCQSKVIIEDIGSQASSNSVGKTTLHVESVTGCLHDLTVFSNNQVDVIKDRIRITEGGISNEVTRTGNVESVWFKAVYEYDGEEFTDEPSEDSAQNKIYVNGTPLLWNNDDKTWKYYTTLEDEGTLTFEVTGVEDNRFNLSSFIDDVGPQSISWENSIYMPRVGMISIATLVTFLLIYTVLTRVKS
jgi:streptogramin lyase